MARRQKARRGVSLGTIVMLMVTCMVIGGFSLVLPRLNGAADVHIDTGKVLEALSLGELLPELSLSEIPISGGALSATATQAPLATLPADLDTPLPTSEPAPQATPTAVPGGSFSMTFGGSIAVDTDLRQANYYSEAKKYDFTEILALLGDSVAADFAMVTLENTTWVDAKLSDSNTAADVLPMLKMAGFNTVALGYRQAYDLGLDGVTATLEAAHQQGLNTLGTYADAANAQPAVMNLGGVQVAVLHYTDVLSNKGAKAMKKDGNTFAVALDAASDGADAILADIASVRAQGAQVVVVSLSWGNDGKTAPTARQAAFAQQLADAGVDAIIGSGSHVVQPAVWLTGNLADGSTKRVLCAYSLGSLLGSSRTNANVAGLLLHLRFSYDGQQATLEEASCTPTYIWRYKQDGRYYYRVVGSHQPAPGGMESSQQDSMARAFQNVQKYLGADSPLTIR